MSGRRPAPIAHELLISLRTVCSHVSSVLPKLQVADRAAAIVKVRGAGPAHKD